MSDFLLKDTFPFLSDSALIGEIEEKAFLKEFNSGDLIIRKGQFLKHVPLIISGSVKILREKDDGEEVLLYYLEGGSTCAMSITCCLDATQSSIHAIAEEDTKLLMVPLYNSDEWMSKYSNWRNFILKSYASRMEELLFALDDVAFNSLDERLWNYLVNKSTVLKSQEIQITHSIIAKELNSSREAISRLLKKLEVLNKVKLGRNVIRVL